MSYFNMQYLKRKHFYHRIQFQTEKVWFIWKKIEKNLIFPIFLSRRILTTSLWLYFSQICAKEFQNWVNLCFGRVLKSKVTKGELVISNGVEMADRYVLGGLEEPPPHWLGLNFIHPAIWITNSMKKKDQQKNMDFLHKLGLQFWGCIHHFASSNTSN